jgi:hypothetical protein
MPLAQLSLSRVEGPATAPERAVSTTVGLSDRMSRASQRRHLRVGEESKNVESKYQMQKVSFWSLRFIIFFVIF